MSRSFQHIGICLMSVPALCIGIVRVHAQKEFDVLTSEASKVPPRKMLSTYLLTEAQKHFNARKIEVAKLSSPEDVRKRQEILRARMIEALGGFPEKTPLNA